MTLLVNRRLIPTLCLALLSCGGPSPPPSSPPGAIATANNRLGWDQQAADGAELATFQYAVYVDGARSEVAGVTCGTEATNGSFACSGRLPAMAPGRHVLQLAAVVMNGDAVLESTKSAPLEIMFAAAATSSAPPGRVAANSAAAVRDAHAASSRIADGLEQISDLAFAPDGRLFVAERAGRIRVIRDGRLLPAPALDVRRQPEAVRPLAVNRDATGHVEDAVLALAFDRQFDRTHFVYVLYTAPSRHSTPSFVVAKYREAADTLADRAVLIDDIPARAPDPAGTLRVGLDGTLYVAFDDGGDARLAGDTASPSGKVLRLNTDGTTPDDQAGGSPLYSAEYRSPRALAWDTESGLLWAADAAEGDRAHVNVVAEATINGRRRGITKAVVSFPQPFDPSALVFLRDSLLVASRLGNGLLRGRVDPGERTRITGMEPLLGTIPGGVQALTVGPDGGVYFATADTVRRLSLP